MKMWFNYITSTYESLKSFETCRVMEHVMVMVDVNVTTVMKVNYVMIVKLDTGNV